MKGIAMMKGVPNGVFITDATHVTVRIPANTTNRADYIYQKGNTTVMMQFSCNRLRMYIDVCGAHCASVNDARSYLLSLGRKAEAGTLFPSFPPTPASPNGKPNRHDAIGLGDSGYHLSKVNPVILTPFDVNHSVGDKGA